jgi:hypothetical protein
MPLHAFLPRAIFTPAGYGLLHSLTLQLDSCSLAGFRRMRVLPRHQVIIECLGRARRRLGVELLTGLILTCRFIERFFRVYKFGLEEDARREEAQRR